MRKFPRLIAIAPPKKDAGQGLVEYALLLSLVAVVCIAILIALGGGVAKVFTQITCTVDGGGPECGCANERITVTGSCVGSTLVANVSSSCPGAQMDITGYGGVPASGNISWSGAPVCTGGSSSFQLYSMHPDGNYGAYNVSP